jgi:hypothetical protein
MRRRKKKPVQALIELKFGRTGHGVFRRSRMSMIGGATTAALNLIGSVVGSARPEAAGPGRGPSSTVTTQADFDAALGESLDDVADAEFSKDRDADGRQLYERRGSDLPASPETPGSEETLTSQLISRAHAADAFGDSGNALDIDA